MKGADLMFATVDDVTGNVEVVDSPPNIINSISREISREGSNLLLRHHQSHQSHQSHRRGGIQSPPTSYLTPDINIGKNMETSVFR